MKTINEPEFFHRIEVYEGIQQIHIQENPKAVHIGFWGNEEQIVMSFTFESFRLFFSDMQKIYDEELVDKMMNK